MAGVPIASEHCPPLLVVGVISVTSASQPRRHSIQRSVRNTMGVINYPVLDSSHNLAERGSNHGSLLAVYLTTHTHVCYT